MEQHDVLTRVGAGTPMGELMRQYWLPALLSSELIPDSAPLRLKLLGEELVAFRTTSGRVGIMHHRCPHRCVSLFYGRNEQDGLRCVFHGWKFDADGQCVEQPNVEAKERIHVRARAYPTTERGGVIWVYMGKSERPPSLPDFPILSLPEERRSVWCEQRACNYLQCIEGELDTSHAGFLHLGGAQQPKDSNGLPPAGSHGLPLDTLNPTVRYRVADTDYGLLAGGYRDAGADQVYWRFANFLFPFWTQPPPCPLGTEAIARAWVPMDDTHTMLFAISTDSFSLANHPKARLAPWQPGFTFTYEFLPNTSDWFGRWRLAACAENDYLIDREVQRTKSFTGIEGLDVQDAAMQESMGSILDRSDENLVTSDVAVVRTRKRLLNAALALREEGKRPPGVDTPDAYNTWCGYIVAPRSADWREVFDKNTPKSCEPFTQEHATVRYGN
jgi:phenylpropionate dioxygenase-like ring-hydroxylating dioxygenase large terminal subunit